SAARGSARATCTARSAALAPAGPRPRGSGAEGSCRRSASCCRLRTGDPLAQLDPGTAVALLDLVRVAHRLQHAMQIEASIGVRRVHLLGCEGPERGAQYAVVGGEGYDEVAGVVAESEQSLDSDLQIVEVVVRHVESHREAASHEVRNRPEVL